MLMVKETGSGPVEIPKTERYLMFPPQEAVEMHAAIDEAQVVGDALEQPVVAKKFSLTEIWTEPPSTFSVYTYSVFPAGTDPTWKCWYILLLTTPTTSTGALEAAEQSLATPNVPAFKL